MKGIEKDKEAASKFKIDVFNTLIGNMLWIYISVFIILFAVFSIGIVNTISDDVNRIVALIVFLFFILKSLSWLGHPSVSWIERERGN